jgi:hypothetical protein
MTSKQKRRARRRLIPQLALAFAAFAGPAPAGA